MKTNRSLAIHTIPHIFLNKMVNFSTRMSSLIISILSHMNPIYVLPLHLFKIRCHVIIPSTLGFTSCLFPSCFSGKTPYKLIFYTYRCNMSCLLISLHFIALILRDGNVNHEIPPSSLYCRTPLAFLWRYSPNPA